LNATTLLKSVDINIPGYTILRPIGEGGMASVFLAVQQSLEREVALKIMSPVLAANTDFANRFLTEGKITAKLQHPNLVTVYDIGTHNGIYYLAAEYVPGGTLKERIQEGGITVADALGVASDIASGLDFAHQKGFVHRDVKPGNVLYRLDGHVVLADFGIAKAMDGSGSSTLAGASIGTPDYMSPEQARGEPVDGRSDLYSLGAMLYEILTGLPPYQAPDMFTLALMHVTYPVPELDGPYLWLQPLIDKLMAKNPAERYSTGAAFVADLNKILASAPQGAALLRSSTRDFSNRVVTGSVTQQRTRIQMAPLKQKKRWRLPVLAGASVLMGASIVWWMLSGSDTPNLDSSLVVTDTQQPDASPRPDVNVNPTTQAPELDLDNLPTNVASPESIDEVAANIDAWLTQADVYLAYSTTAKDPGRKLSSPEDDSALGYYRRVLELDPQNTRARKGMQDIAAYYAEKAFQLCDLKRYQACGIIVREGLAVESENVLLRQLEQAYQAGERGEVVLMPPPR
jgi:serine/threonine-protein kinase PpkA